MRRKQLLILAFAVFAGLPGISCAGAYEPDESEESEINDYPNEGVLQHTVQIEITTEPEPDATIKSGGAGQENSGFGEDGNLGNLGNLGDDGVAGDARATGSTALFGKSFRIDGRAGFLARQILRDFLSRHDYTLRWEANYDCRLASGVSLISDELPDLIAQYLQFFSLSARIVKNHRFVAVFPARTNAKVCTAAANRAILDNRPNKEKKSDE